MSILDISVFWDHVMKCLETEEKNITNETFGKTIEWLLSKLYSLPYSAEDRINRKYITPDIFESSESQR